MSGQYKTASIIATKGMHYLIHSHKNSERYLVKLTSEKLSNLVNIIGAIFDIFKTFELGKEKE